MAVGNLTRGPNGHWTARARGKLVLVGDDCQLSEIDAGGAFRALAARLGASELLEVRRQRELWPARDRMAAGIDVADDPLAAHTGKRAGATMPRMCAGCAMAAMAGASGVRCWLQTHRLGWLTARRLRRITIVVFAAATLASSVTLAGSSPAERHAAVASHEKSR